MHEICIGYITKWVRWLQDTFIFLGVLTVFTFLVGWEWVGYNFYFEFSPISIERKK